MTIGEYIKSKRLKKGYTVPALHKASGVAMSTICRIEAGNVPHLDSMTAICAVLGVKPSSVLKACGL